MRAIEIFSCSGALALGFRDAGITFDLAFDRDSEACESYAENLGTRPICVDVRDLLRLLRAGWHPGDLDLVVADPPCAPWSRAGKRAGLDDERDMLRETIEAIALLRPRAYLIGNIPGLEDAPNLRTVQATIGSLRRHGYCVRDFALLDAADYGVPQRRVRPFWYGHREGLCLRWPARTHCDPRELRQTTIQGVDPLLPWVSCREALERLPASEIGRPVRLRHEGKRATPRHPPSEQHAPARAVLAGAGTGSQRALVVEPSAKKRPPSTKGHQSARIGNPEEPSRTVDARVARVGAGDSSVLAWPWDQPSTTVCAGLDVLSPPKRSGSRGESQASHPNAIVLSERAACVLQGLPKTWVIVGKTKRARWSQIGQAVPRVVAAAIALRILEQFASVERSHSEKPEAVAC
jgi:DNA (cytosine-5)-methyltransferase 1